MVTVEDAVQIVEEGFRLGQGREREECYLVAADAAQDAGDEQLAAGLRWLAAGHYGPVQFGTPGVGNECVWTNDLVYDSWESNLPPDVFTALEGGKVMPLTVARVYPAFGAAVVAAARASQIRPPST